MGVEGLMGVAALHLALSIGKIGMSAQGVLVETDGGQVSSALAQGLVPSWRSIGFICRDDTT